ncbi:Elongation factor 1-beta [Quaeritorhiza haematococci]|nr:Elongation factor 1-beta [Quaeritorhiza haematococci]
MGFANLDKDTGVKVLNDYLEERSYIEGYQPSQADVAVFEAMKSAPNADKFPHAARWYSHIASFGAAKAKFPGQKKAASAYGPAGAAPAAAPPAKKEEKKEEEDDDIDLFGSDEEEDAEAEKLKAQRLADYHAKKAASNTQVKMINSLATYFLSLMAMSRNLLVLMITTEDFLLTTLSLLSTEPKVIAKSMIILDVKPWDDETDMKALEKGVRDIALDGLVWGTSKLVAVGYGIKKLQITCVVEDDKVGVDDLSEKITELEDYVQSVDVAAFNKL